MTVDLQELARQIANRMADDALLDAEDVASMLKCSPRQVLERYALAPGFPATIRLRGPDGAKGHPRWLRADIAQWISRHKEGNAPSRGRPRNRPYEVGR